MQRWRWGKRCWNSRNSRMLRRQGRRQRRQRWGWRRQRQWRWTRCCVHHGHQRWSCKHRRRSRSGGMTKRKNRWRRGRRYRCWSWTRIKVAIVGIGTQRGFQPAERLFIDGFHDELCKKWCVERKTRAWVVFVKPCHRVCWKRRKETGTHYHIIRRNSEWVLTEQFVFNFASLLRTRWIKSLHARAGNWLVEHACAQHRMAMIVAIDISRNRRTMVDGGCSDIQL